MNDTVNTNLSDVVSTEIKSEVVSDVKPEASPEPIYARISDMNCAAIKEGKVNGTIFLIRCSNEKLRVLISNGVCGLSNALFKRSPFQLYADDVVSSSDLSRLAKGILWVASNDLVAVVDGNFENQYVLKELNDILGTKYNVVDVVKKSEFESRVRIINNTIQNKSSEFFGMEIILDDDEDTDIVKAAEGVLGNFYQTILPVIEPTQDSSPPDLNSPEVQAAIEVTGS